MGWAWIDGISAARRFGAAVRLQDAGRLAEAKAALLVLGNWFEGREATGSVQLLSARLMSLVHLAEVAKQLGERSLALGAVRQWIAVWEGAVSRMPSLGKVEALAKWEAWAKSSLADLEEPAASQ